MPQRLADGYNPRPFLLPSSGSPFHTSQTATGTTDLPSLTICRITSICCWQRPPTPRKPIRSFSLAPTTLLYDDAVSAMTEAPAAVDFRKSRRFFLLDMKRPPVFSFQCSVFSFKSSVYSVQCSVFGKDCPLQSSETCPLKTDH